MNKYKNYGLWVAVFSLIGIVLMDLVPTLDKGRYQEYVDIILSILVMAGIISSPQVGKWFKDKQ
jgi:uncharacterized membrane protein